VALGVLAVLVVVSVTLFSVSSALAGPPGWKIVSSSNPSPIEGNLLNSVAAITPHDVWAVGMRSANTGPQTLTEHWNGAQWSVVSSPNVPGVNNALGGVAAVSAHDVWAVGFSNPGHTLTEHWNGATWSIVPSPNMGPATAFNTLNGVAAVAANDVWAVGYVADGMGNARTLIEHWNGVSWTLVPSPDVDGANPSDNLFGVVAISANNVWAVGNSVSPNTGTTPSRTLIEHWNGVRWVIVPSPNALPGLHSNWLVSVSGVAANDVWAVGYHQKIPPMPGPTYTLIEHWDGASWKLVPSPTLHPGVDNNSLLGVAAITSHDVWAVGAHGTTSPSLPQTLTEHWNGSSWTVVSSPNLHPGVDSNVLAGVAALSAQDVWAVGNHEDLSTNIQETLTELYH
jgi:hypothetical protein